MEVLKPELGYMFLIYCCIPTGSKLIPDESSCVGKEVARLWKLVNSVRIGIMTFGILTFQDLSATDLTTMAQTMAKSNGTFSNTRKIHFEI